jgi:hypothetical protein
MASKFHASIQVALSIAAIRLIIIALLVFNLDASHCLPESKSSQWTFGPPVLVATLRPPRKIDHVRTSYLPDKVRHTIWRHHKH